MRNPLLLACLATLMLGACDVAPPPPTDVDAKIDKKKDGGHHELQSAIDAVDKRDKAAHAADPVMEADKAHDKQLEDAGG